MTPNTQPVSVRTDPVPASCVRRDDEVYLRDDHTTLFRHRLLVRNEATGRESQVKFPAAFDCEANGRTQWSDVIEPQTLLTVEPRPRPVPFECEAVPDGVARDQMRGYFVLPVYFYADPRLDDLTFQYAARNVFTSMADGMECYYFDVFLPTDRASPRITGDGFPVRLQAALPVRRESCRAYELMGFQTGRELPRDVADRAIDGRDGTLRQVTTADGTTAIHWDLTTPRPNTRYKIFFQANPAEKVVVDPGDALRRYEAELDRLFADDHAGKLAAYRGEYVLGAGGRILDHHADAFVLRERAARVARENAVPVEEVVEYYVPSDD